MGLSEEIRKKAKKYRDYTANNLSAIVKIPSYSGKEEAVCKKIVELAREAGLDEVRIDGLGSVVGRIGSGPKKLAFDAHIDIVEAGDESQWEHDPFSGLIRDGLVYGRGATDQKGGAASMLTAGRILKEQGYEGDYSIYFTFTVMEEDCDGMCWKYLIEEEKLVPDFFVSTEPTSLQLTRGHRGRMEIVCRFKGISCHGSAPERGVNAAYKAARAALAVEKLNSDLKPDDDGFLGKGTIVVSQIDAHGPSQCAVPDEGMIYLDRRLTWGENAEIAINQVKKYMGADVHRVEMPLYTKKGYKGTDYSQELYFPTWKIPENHPLVRSGVQAYRELFGREPVVDKWTFSTNAVSVCGRHRIPSIGFGPGDEKQAHAPNETNRIDDLEICSAFYAMLPYIIK
ncbi:MAG: YgeY family selenium metabolism-linked hydrolase [Spirochaetota bacterium]